VPRCHETAVANDECAEPTFKEGADPLDPEPKLLLSCEALLFDSSVPEGAKVMAKSKNPWASISAMKQWRICYVKDGKRTPRRSRHAATLTRRDVIRAEIAQLDGAHEHDAGRVGAT
jgi:hypothetical protein